MNQERQNKIDELTELYWTLRNLMSNKYLDSKQQQDIYEVERVIVGKLKQELFLKQLDYDTSISTKIEEENSNEV